MKIRTTARAKADIRALFRLIRSYDQGAATTFLTKLDAGFQTLSEYPASGAECPELGLGVRRKTIGLTLVFYRIEPDAILILRALDGRMDIETEFDK